MDPFATLGIEPRFDVDLPSLEQRHRDLSRALHPDRYTGAPGAERRMALSKAIEVNEAMRTLREPIRRAEAILRRAGIEMDEVGGPKPPPALLMEMMEIREELAEARAAKDAPRAAAVGRAMKDREQRTMASLSDTFREGAGDPAALAAAIPLLGELRYLKRCLEEVSAIEEDISPDSPEAGSRRAPGPTMALLEIFDPKAAPRPIGIDLGTTNSLVARVRDGKPVVIANCDGDRLIPSAAYYDPRGPVIVGRTALRLAAQRPRETIVSVKRFMGRGADDPETRRLGTYEFVPPNSPEEAKSVRFRVNDKVVTPVEVSAEILKVLKQNAEDELQSVGGAVITVPAYFDDAQRQATRDAGRLAGLDVLRLLNEPTAAALAYGLEKQQNGVFAVYDLGGGTFDVTILLLDNGVFQVKSTGGDSALGGDDMDRALAEVLLGEMGAGAPADRSPDLVRVALDAARQVKHALTDAPEVEAEIPVRGGSGDATRKVLVTRDRTPSGEGSAPGIVFNELIAPIVERTGVAARRALRDAGIQASELDGVILVGGSTRVPYVRDYVARTFGKEPLGDINPDEVVALGAAIQADILAGSQDHANEVLLLDVLPLSLGIETMGGVAEKVLPRNTTIPAGARQIFTTYADNQTGFDLHIVQGERELAVDCRSLARFVLKGIPPMPAGMARLEVTFTVNADGLLKVAAKELTTGVEQQVEVKPSYGLTDQEVEDMLLAALDHGEEDLHRRRLVEERVEAERVLHATRKSLAADEDLLDSKERQAIDDAMRALEEAMAGEKPDRIRARIEGLDDVTHGWAGRRMDRAIAKAIEGKQVQDVETAVSGALGVDAHVASHGAGGH